jgi:cytoskeletal protein CcmA (bactofilin family)
MGSMEGEITVIGLLSLKASAKIKGDIITNKISIEPGAVLTGTINMDNSPSNKIGQANAQEKASIK